MGITLQEYFHGKMQSLVESIRESPLDVDTHEKFIKQYDRFSSRDKISSKDLLEYLDQARKASGFKGEDFDRVLKGEFN